MKRGDEIWMRRGDGEMARFRVATAGPNLLGTWLDGALAGREARLDREAAREMAEAARGGRAPKVLDLAEPEISMEEALALDREKLEALGADPGPTAQDLGLTDPGAEAKRAAARERVRAWRAAKKALKSEAASAVEPGRGEPDAAE